jgi:hypothetical protein
MLSCLDGMLFLLNNLESRKRREKLEETNDFLMLGEN